MIRWKQSKCLVAGPVIVVGVNTKVHNFRLTAQFSHFSKTRTTIDRQRYTFNNFRKRHFSGNRICLENPCSIHQHFSFFFFLINYANFDTISLSLFKIFTLQKVTLNLFCLETALNSFSKLSSQKKCKKATNTSLHLVASD